MDSLLHLKHHRVHLGCPISPPGAAPDSRFSQIQLHAPSVLVLSAVVVLVIQTFFTVVYAEKRQLPEAKAKKNTANGKAKDSEKLRRERPQLQVIQSRTHEKQDGSALKNGRDKLGKKQGRKDESTRFAPHFIFQSTSLALVCAFAVEYVSIIVQLVSCHPATEPVLFYLTGCLTIYLFAFFSLANNPKKAPSLQMFVVWLIGLAVEVSLLYLSSTDPAARSVVVSVPKSDDLRPVPEINVLTASIWLMRRVRVFILFVKVVSYFVCLFEVGRAYLLQTAHALRLGALIKPPVNEKSKIVRLGEKFSQLSSRVDSLYHSNRRPSSALTRSHTLADVRAFVSRPSRSDGPDRMHLAQDSKNLHSPGIDHRHGGSKPVKKEDVPSWGRAKKNKFRTWWDYVIGYRTFSKYLWPGPYKLRLSVIACVIICFFERTVNPLSSFYLNRITSTLEEAQILGTVGFIPVRLIMIYGALKLVQGSKGWLQQGRSLMWMPVQEYTFGILSFEVYNHVQSLPLSFHATARATELLSAINKGRSVTTFLENVSFSVIPGIIDIAITITYFFVQFGATYARAIAVMSCWYIYATMSLAQWRTVARREMADADRHLDDVKLDGLMSFKTNKYFDTDGHVEEKIRLALDRFQRCRWNAHLAHIVMEGAQSLIFICGLIVVCLIGTSQITQGNLRTSDLATLMDYMVQLRGPLNVFSDFYRMVQNTMINAERLTELFKLAPRIVDSPDAVDIKDCKGNIELKDVEYTFEGAENATLKGLTISFPAGSYTALVGASGGGKSTIFDLLFRFFDANAGTITLDGRKITEYKWKSIVKHMTIVPQDIVLAHDTIINNLRHVREDATDEEIYEACRDAHIHDDIVAQPQGYDTLVGGGGETLSGGQRQRIGLARAILRKAKIIVMDEPTSALDATTEQKVQQTIENLARKQGRTVIVIAHRLFTITTADQIYVIDDGAVVEHGTQGELLDKKNGRYATLWRVQKLARQRQKARDMLKAQVANPHQSRRHSISESNMFRTGMFYNRNQYSIPTRPQSPVDVDADAFVSHPASRSSSATRRAYSGDSGDGDVGTDDDDDGSPTSADESKPELEKTDVPLWRENEVQDENRELQPSRTLDWA